MKIAHKNHARQVLFIALVMFSAINTALADLQGGINKVTGYANQLKTGMLTVGAIIAVIYLLWKAFECWGGRAEWKEFGLSVLYVAMAGASAALANWAWNAFIT